MKVVEIDVLITHLSLELRAAAEQLAEHVLSRHSAQVPVDVDVIARDEGLIYEYLPLKRTSGAYVRDMGCGGASLAFINACHPRAGQRCTQAHYLSHPPIAERFHCWVQQRGP